MELPLQCINATFPQNGQDILDNLSDLKVKIVDRYDKWLQKHPDEADHERTPNARTQTIPTEAQREGELARQEREQQRLAAEEAAKWKLQRQQLYAAEEAENARRREVAAQNVAASPRQPMAPDYTFSRTPMQNNGIGSQSTVVISDGRPSDELLRHQQKEQARLHEEAEKRRIEDIKKQQEREAIAQQQQRAEDAARFTRQNAPPPPPVSAPSPSIASFSSASPMFPNYSASSATTTPSSVYFHTPTRIEYPTVQARSAGPSVQSNPHIAAATRIMPLESPSEGDSTDSESIHYDYRKLHKPRAVEARTPARNIRR